MCYGYGLRESELNEATPQFVSLFLQGNARRETERVQALWTMARFIGSAMSKEAGKVKFPWEKKQIKKVEIPDEVWSRFTLDESGVTANYEQVKKVFGL